MITMYTYMLPYHNKRQSHIDYANPPLPTVTSIPLTSSQAVRIHGWSCPSRRLAWQAVRDRTDLSFCTLFTIMSDGQISSNSYQAGRALDMLFMLQPNIMEWISCQKVALVDYEVRTGSMLACKCVVFHT